VKLHELLFGRPLRATEQESERVGAVTALSVAVDETADLWQCVCTFPETAATEGI
jgi:hypothetical protein